jgi:hypothetical protein
MQAAFLLLLAACGNATNPGADAAFIAIDAPIDVTEPDASPMRVLVINEVWPATPDWFEIVNVSDAPVQSSCSCTATPR